MHLESMSTIWSRHLVITSPCTVSNGETERERETILQCNSIFALECTFFTGNSVIGSYIFSKSHGQRYTKIGYALQRLLDELTRFQNIRRPKYQIKPKGKRANEKSHREQRVAIREDNN